MDEIIFYMLSAVCIATALVMLIRPGVLSGAMSLYICMLAASGLMALLDAPYIAVAYAVIFAGSAMLMIIVSTIMSNSRPLARRRGSIGFGRVVATIAAFYFTIVIVISIMRPPFVEAPLSGDEFRGIYTLGRMLGSGYMVVIILAGLAISAAIVSVFAIIRYGLEEEKR